MSTLATNFFKKVPRRGTLQAQGKSVAVKDNHHTARKGVLLGQIDFFNMLLKTIFIAPFR